MELSEITSLLIATASLAVSVVALVVAKRVAVVSIAQPLVLQQLYEVAEHLGDRQLSPDPVKDMQRLIDEIHLVRRKDVILRKAHFGPELNAFEDSVGRYVRVRKELEAKGGGNTSEEERLRFLSALSEVDTRLQSLLKRIRQKLEELLTDPFG